MQVVEQYYMLLQQLLRWGGAVKDSKGLRLLHSFSLKGRDIGMNDANGPGQIKRVVSLLPVPYSNFVDEDMDDYGLVGCRRAMTPSAARVHP